MKFIFKIKWELLGALLLILLDLVSYVMLLIYGSDQNMVLLAFVINFVTFFWMLNYKRIKEIREFLDRMWKEWYYTMI